MNVILTLSLSGSCLLIMYLIISKAGSNLLTPGAKYILLRIALIYFLIPLPNVRSFYLGILHNIFGWDPYADTNLHIEGAKAVFVGDSSLFLSDTFEYVLAFFLVWFSVALFILISRMIRQRREMRHIHKNSRCLEEPRELSRLEALRQEYGIRRKVTVYICRLDNVASMTCGVWKPEIIIPEKVSEDAMELVIRHELVHIKRFDAFIRILTTFAVSFHWFNPFIYCLRNHLDMQCEFSCDEKAMRSMDDGQLCLYAKTILKQARDSSGEEGSPEEKLMVSLTGGGKQIEERIVCIMKRKEKGSKAHAVRAAIVVTAAVLLNSLTVFAYDDVNQISVSQQSQEIQTELNSISESVGGYYIESGYSDAAEITYDEQFTDEEGNVYSAGRGIQPSSICNHTYQAGTYQTHTKSTDGGCTVKVYSAKRCTGCGLIVIMEYLNTITYATCTH